MHITLHKRLFGMGLSVIPLLWTSSCVQRGSDVEKQKEGIWSPLVTRIVFSVDGGDLAIQVHDLKPGVTFFAPGISVRDTGALRVKTITCRPVQIAKALKGMQMLDVSGTPGRDRFAALGVRIRCTVRKQMRATAFGHGADDCFDEGDELFSTWLTRADGDWDFELPEKIWAVHSKWDYLRIQVQTREVGTQAIVSMPSIVNAYVRLLPTEPMKRLAWMTAHSAAAAIGGNEPCKSQ